MTDGKRLGARTVKSVRPRVRGAIVSAAIEFRHPARGEIMRRVTKTDRIACPWLIRRLIDPEAEFLYVPADEVLAVAEREAPVASA